MATETTATSATELVPTEKIGLYIQSVNLPERIGLTIAWAEPGQGSIAVRFPRLDGITVPAGTKTEAADFSRVEQLFSESTITPGLVGFEQVITDEAMVMTVKGPAIRAVVIDNALRHLWDRVDTDVLASSTSSTNTTGATTDVFGRDKFQAAIAAYNALDIPGLGMGVALVLDQGPMADLTADMVLSTATTADRFAGLLGPSSGYRGNVFGVEVFCSSRVATEGAGMSNFMTPIGYQASGLGIVVQEWPRLDGPARGVLGNRAAMEFHVLRAWYGCGLTNPNRILEVLSAA